MPPACATGASSPPSPLTLYQLSLRALAAAFSDVPEEARGTKLSKKRPRTRAAGATSISSAACGDASVTDKKNAMDTIYEVSHEDGVIEEDGVVEEEDEFVAFESVLDPLQASVTESMRLDVYLEMLRQKRFGLLVRELSHLDRFLPLLGLGEKRTRLHTLFQTLVDRNIDLHERLTAQLTERLRRHDETEIRASVNTNTRQLVTYLNFASFLSEAGWYESSERVLRGLKTRLDALLVSSSACKMDSSVVDALRGVRAECTVKLLNALRAYCKFTEAEEVYQEMLTDWVPEVGGLHSTSSPGASAGLTPVHSASVCAAFSSLFFYRSQYHMSLSWGMEALRALRPDHPPRVIIDVLSQAGKACVVRRQFAKAKILIQEAVLLAKEVFGENHPKYAECLSDFGFYMLNIDCITKSLKAYETVFNIRRRCFGPRNLRVALSHEDLAYAYYVKEYNSGKFKYAKTLAEKALNIMTTLLSPRHLLMASSQRVLALIVEEIAIDEPNKTVRKKLLARSEQLHLQALELSVKAFGESNVQTSKHYGNLGRLYQSMGDYKQAETMHLRAIKIKEELLGRDDYEVALSIGHLASLYNYDLGESAKAETLYLRSVAIGEKLFGPAYSGLEYDYRGLVKVYQDTGQYDRAHEFSDRLREWRKLRDEREQQMLEEQQQQEQLNNEEVEQGRGGSQQWQAASPRYSSLTAADPTLAGAKPQPINTIVWLVTREQEMQQDVEMIEEEDTSSSVST